ncbi:hypothetical protein [Tenacibaculum agarivorans]|uniref:hypothetical protein n=1 Tax=Tenacibaculum agarivorans TaxID=1908389 RepID=UPI00094B85CD|nr:hypothetical protein [Tenacibaculum agarivorans]
MKNLFTGILLTIAFILTGCSDDRVVVPESGVLNGGPFDFIIDGVADNVSGITVTGNTVGKKSTFIITDAAGEILGLPGDMAALEAVDFDGAGEGVCYIWYVTYESSISGLEVGNNANDLTGIYDLSNKLTVNRNPPSAGMLTGGPFTFAVGDGTADNVSGISVDGDPKGDNSSFIITDNAGKILGLPADMDALEGVDFDGTGTGVCLIWYIRYQDGLQGLAVDANASGLMGVFDLSDSITVNRVDPPMAGTLNGGPFNFTVDGTADNVSGITVTGTPVGSKSSFIITDDMGKILGLPATMTDLEGVNFDDAGAGVCLIWYIRYEGDLEGLEVDANANDIKGVFDLSNSITVNRS